MNQYIIDEEKLDNIADLLKRNAIFQSVIDEHLDGVYNHPYNPQSERDKVLDVGEILESLCKTDLYWYNKGVTEGEDVSKCRGKDCNYCGRYNAELRSKEKQG